MQWLPPENPGPLPPLSLYEIIATPHLAMYYYNDHDVIDQSNSDDSIPVDPKQRTSNLQGQNQHQISFLDTANRSLARGFDPNSTCIEVVCERRSMRIDASFTMVNVSGLVPALSYELVVLALSNGTNLISRPSDAVSITTRHSGNDAN